MCCNKFHPAKYSCSLSICRLSYLTLAQIFSCLETSLQSGNITSTSTGIYILRVRSPGAGGGRIAG